MSERVQEVVWTDQQPMTFFGVPIGRRCAVVRLLNGQRVVFSPLEASPQNVQTLRTMDHVSAFVVPSRLHDRYYEGYFSAFPNAVFLANDAAIEDHPKWPLRNLREHLSLLPGLRVEELKGMPLLQEQVFLHEASRTLIVADALFNVRRGRTWVDRVLMFGAGIGQPPRVCRLFRLMVRDRRALAASMNVILSWDFDRLVPGHGEVIEAGAKAVLREAYRGYLA